MTIGTCRFCKKHDSRRMIKYSVRHYMHHDCYLKAGKKLSDLHDWQIASFPYLLAADHGLTKEVEGAYRRVEGAVDGRAQKIARMS